LAAGQARSIRDALQAVEGGAVASPEAALALGQDGRVIEALGVVAAHLEALQESNVALRSEVAELRSEVATLWALPASQRPGEATELREGAESEGIAVRAARWLERLMRGQEG